MDDLMISLERLANEVKLLTKEANNLHDSAKLFESVQTLRDMTQVQCNDGNWNFDPYMHGMANGMIFALSIFEEGCPEYLEAPETWIKDTPQAENVVKEAANVQQDTVSNEGSRQDRCEDTGC